MEPRHGAVGNRTRLGARFRAVAITASALIPLLAPSSSPAAASPPQVTSSFTPALITTGGTSALSFTITNPNASGNLAGVSLTDTLPSGLVVDSQPGTTVSSTCSSKTAPATVTANPGTGTIAISGATVAPGAAGACTVTVSVTSATVGVVHNSTGPVTATGTAPGNSDTESLTVAGVPTVSVGAPRQGATYTFKRKVRVRFSCQEGTLGPGLSDCAATDENDKPVTSGSLLDTSVAGAHTLTVDATSSDGQITEDTINYTVEPDNRFKVSHLTASAGGAVAFELKLPGAGRVTVLATAPKANLAGGPIRPGRGEFAFARLTRLVHRAGTFRLTVRPSGRGAFLLTHHRSAVVIRLIVAYTPAGGVRRIVVVRGIAIP